MKGVFHVEDKARELRNAYMREWRRRNKDKVKKSQEKYWMKKSEGVNDNAKY